MKEKETTLDKLGKVINIAANAVAMNLLFLVACLPVVTIGAAWNGLFSAIRYNIRGEKWVRGFWIGFKTRFLRSLLSWLVLIIPILWVAEVDIIGVLLDENGVFRALEAFSLGSIIPLVFACVIFLMLTGMMAALMLLNVYIPTKVGEWISGGANLVFKAPLQMAVTGLLMWFPLLLVQLLPSYFYIFAMIFVVAYFVLAALVMTMLMKKPLLDCLIEAREAGTLLNDEEEEKEKKEEKEENPEERPEENA